MKSLFVLAALAAIFWGVPGQAQAVERDEFLTAPIYLAPGDSAGRTIQTLVGCLENWKEGPSDKRPRNEVKIDKAGRDRWEVATTLRSHASFSFTVSREGGKAIALLNRVQYKIEQRGFQQLTDSETKKTVLDAVCK